MGNLGEDSLSPVMSALSAADISLKEYILILAYAHTDTNVFVHKKNHSRNMLTTAKTAQYTSISPSLFVIQMSGKGAFNGIAHHSSEWQHPDTLQVPYVAGAIKAP